MWRALYAEIECWVKMTSIRGLESHLCTREVHDKFDDVPKNIARGIHIKPNPNWPSLVNMIYSLEMGDNDSKRTRPHTQNTTQNCREYHSTEDPEDWTYLNRRNIIKWIMQTFPSLFQSSRQFSVSPFSYLRNINQGVKFWIFYCWCFTRGFQKMKRILFVLE